MPAQNTPLVLAHRGASAYAPENTFAAFDLALEMSSPAFETDVRVTADGQLVLLHDERVDRTTNGQGRVADLTLAEVESLDAGSWFGPGFAGQRIPTLAAFAARYASRVPICFEIKALGIERQFLDFIATVEFAHAPAFTAFEFETVANLAALAPQYKVGYLTRQFDQETIERTRAVGARQICPVATALQPDLIAAAREVGLEVRAWGIGGDALMEKCVDLGVDGFTTNWPDRALRRIAAGE